MSEETKRSDVGLGVISVPGELMLLESMLGMGLKLKFVVERRDFTHCAASLRRAAEDFERMAAAGPVPEWYPREDAWPPKSWKIGEPLPTGPMT